MSENLPAETESRDTGRLDLGQKLYGELSQLLDEATLRHQREYVRSRLARSACVEFAAQDEIVSILANLSADLRFSYPTHRLINDRWQAIYDSSRGTPERAEYEALKREESQYEDIDREYHPRYVLSASQPEAQNLLSRTDMLGDTVRVDDKLSMPFAEYRRNTDAVWRYVPHDTVTTALDRKSFVSTDGLNLTQEGISVVIEPDDDTLEFPISLITSAAGFESWRGRSENVGKSYTSKFGGGQGGSLEAIKHYASLETDIPPIGKIYMYVQPDGTVFSTNGSGDSHRIAVAYLRGQKTISAKELEILRLTDNIL